MLENDFVHYTLVKKRVQNNPDLLLQEKKLALKRYANKYELFSWYDQSYDLFCRGDLVTALFIYPSCGGEVIRNGLVRYSVRFMPAICYGLGLSR